MRNDLKTLISALIILCFVILSTVLVAVYTDKLLTSFNNTIEEKISDDTDDTLYGINDLESEYKKIKPFLVLFIRGSDVKEIEMYIEDAKSAAKESEAAALAEAKSRLMLHIDQLRRLSIFSVEAIF